MKRPGYLLLLLFSVIQLFARQDPSGSKIVYKPVVPVFESVKPGIHFESHKKTLQWLMSRYLPENKGQHTLLPQKPLSSPVGKHLRFDHYYQGLPVFSSYIQVNYTHSGALYSVINALGHETPVSEGPVNGPGTLWINTLNGLVRGFSERVHNPETGEFENRLVSEDGQEVYRYPAKFYFQGPDSSISTMVWLPNPIVARNVKYGGNYSDNNDKNTAELTAARDRVRIPVEFRGGKFRLKNGYLTVKNVEDPVVQPVEPTDTFVNYTRDMSGFEDVNAYYHLVSYSKYIKRMGFSDLLDSIYVDTHGALGDDNSSFDPARYPYVLDFGTGGVDDAEDGQVVIHEFAHSLSYLASMGTSLGSERNSMEEGQADYIAMSYSRSLRDVKPYDVFSWDGHNDIWDGFNAKTSRKYKNLSGIKDIDRNIWSSPLMCIYEHLGRQKADSIILSYYYHQAIETTMPQMAGMILKMDSLLYKGRHLAAIWQCFTNWEILDTVPWYLTRIKDIDPSPTMRLINSSGFAMGTDPLKIELLIPALWKSLTIRDLTGRTISVLEPAREIELKPGDFPSGVYVLDLHSADGRYRATRRLLRY